MIAFTLFFEYTRFGLVMRGMADNRQAAVMMGADEQRTNLGAWVLAGVGAAIAGLTLSTYSPLTLSFPDLAFLAFPAVVLGGIDSIPGALAGGILIGIVQQMAGGYISADFSTTAGFIVMLGVLLSDRPACSAAARSFVCERAHPGGLELAAAELLSPTRHDTRVASH